MKTAANNANGKRQTLLTSFLTAKPRPPVPPHDSDNPQTVPLREPLPNNDNAMESAVLLKQPIIGTHSDAFDIPVRRKLDFSSPVKKRCATQLTPAVTNTVTPTKVDDECGDDEDLCLADFLRKGNTAAPPPQECKSLAPQSSVPKCLSSDLSIIPVQGIAFQKGGVPAKQSRLHGKAPLTAKVQTQLDFGQSISQGEKCVACGMFLTNTAEDIALHKKLCRSVVHGAEQKSHQAELMDLLGAEDITATVSNRMGRQCGRDRKRGRGERQQANVSRRQGRAAHSLGPSSFLMCVQECERRLRADLSEGQLPFVTLRRSNQSSALFGGQQQHVIATFDATCVHRWGRVHQDLIEYLSRDAHLTRSISVAAEMQQAERRRDEASSYQEHKENLYFVVLLEEIGGSCVASAAVREFYREQEPILVARCNSDGTGDCDEALRTGFRSLRRRTKCDVTHLWVRPTDSSISDAATASSSRPAVLQNARDQFLFAHLFQENQKPISQFFQPKKGSCAAPPSGEAIASAEINPPPSSSTRRLSVLQELLEACGSCGVVYGCKLRWTVDMSFASFLLDEEESIGCDLKALRSAEGHDGGVALFSHKEAAVGDVDAYEELEELRNQWNTAIDDTDDEQLGNDAADSDTVPSSLCEK